MAYVGEIRAICPLCSRTYKLGSNRNQSIGVLRSHLIDFHNTSDVWAANAAQTAFAPLEAA